MRNNRGVSTWMWSGTGAPSIAAPSVESLMGSRGFHSGAVGATENLFCGQRVMLERGSIRRARAAEMRRAAGSFEKFRAAEHGASGHRARAERGRKRHAEAVERSRRSLVVDEPRE